MPLRPSSANSGPEGSGLGDFVRSHPAPRYRLARSLWRILRPSKAARASAGWARGLRPGANACFASYADFLRRSDRNADDEGSSSAGSRLELDGATQRLDHPPRDVQAQARALDAAGARV